KIGVYKDKDNTIYAIQPKCPHLGCQLEWNPDELSWDCPCHGSRFDYKGNQINGPAQEGIAHE
ncbi:MAG TPA: Rieske 2Fe-2S domain-containing protein, partial [Candidatus Scybalomonas excrementigallinarum]|nr:Rieske 2Fe-2S domain-containing protein [Candidatus Scybalomonas excrementigallinarum]